MPEIKPRTIVLRCPVCFARENDVTLFRDGEEYYCIKCSFTGTDSEVRAMYTDLRKKYHWILKRVPLEEQRNI